MSLVITHRGLTATHELRDGAVYVIGRSRECDVFIDDHQVSRRHAEVRVARDAITITDLGSHNGTLIVESADHEPAETVTHRRLTTRLPANVETAVPGDAMLQVGSALVTFVSSLRNLRRATQPGLGSGIVIADPAMQRLLELAERIAPTDLSVLVLGESGVGKDVVARYLHGASPRAGHRLVTLNCGALPEHLLESELFGYERGAFTGATAAKPGLFEVADRGTVFLDEIGELSPALQVKLLRVLEDRMVQRVGALAPRAVDVRYIAATNRDLERAIGDGKFREDLFYRLHGIALHVPPLRERRAEIIPLAERFVADFAPAATPQLSPAARDALHAHTWPGNVRELKNVIQRAVAMAGSGVIDVADLGLAGSPRRSQPVVETTVQAGDEGERQRIVDALDACAGNQTRAAELLGITRRVLVRRLDKYQIPRPRDRRD